jgi:sulfite reductase (NADPH) flavoprotein alpha-component
VTAPRELALIVAYGSDMGNAEDSAMSFAEALEEAIGVGVTAIELNQVELADLRSATHFIAVTSTFGVGEFPDNATLFWEAISADTANNRPRRGRPMSSSSSPSTTPLRGRQASS